MSLLVNFTLYQIGWFRGCSGSGKQSTLVWHDLSPDTRRCSPCTRSWCVSSFLPGSCFRDNWLHTRQPSALAGSVSVSQRTSPSAVGPALGCCPMDTICHALAVLPSVGFSSLHALLPARSGRWPDGLLCGESSSGPFTSSSADDAFRNTCCCVGVGVSTTCVVVRQACD